MMERASWWILGAAVLAAAVGGYMQHVAMQPQTEATSSSTIIGQSLPTLRLHTLDGKSYALNRYLGQRLLLNLWASGCGPCRDEMPTIDRWQQGSGANRVQVVGIAMDEPQRAQAFLTAHPVSYPILMGQVSPIGGVDTALQLGDQQQLLPYSVLVGADGRIMAAHAGEMSRQQLQAWSQL